ncbi:MAG TPA: hypothetical protein VF642_12295 [Propionibacteriaceae bacterium]|jgi:hypothetical protein
MPVPPQWLVHRAGVEVYDSTTGEFAPEVEVPCFFLKQVTSRYRDTDGSESVADATLHLDPGDPIPTGSRVTVNGYGGKVVAVTELDDGGITGLAHRELLLRVWPL